MKTLLDDRAVAARVLHHIDHKTTDAGVAVWREPVENYLSQARFDEELKRVLRRQATPFCPSAALPEPGAYIAREAAGIPLLVTRGDDGQVRAFRNACRHRGAQVAEGSGCVKAFRCAYHGWTYRLDGSLQHIPHSEGFPGLETDHYGLVPVRAEERAGLVFVTQDGAAPIGEIEDLEGLLGPDQQCFASRSFELEVNWKVFIESFLEGYHIKPAHRGTFYPFGYDNLNVVETFGRNARLTFPFRRIERLAELDPSDREVDGLLTYIYQLFPNVILAVLSHHISMVVLEPVAVGKTRIVTYSLTNNPLDGEEAIAKARHDAEFVNDSGLAEDIALARSIQASINSGANEVFTFGLYEKLIGHFHRSLDELLAG